MESKRAFIILFSVACLPVWAADIGTPVSRHLLVSIPDRKIVLFENDEPTRVYDIAVGASRTPTPSGQFTIVSRVEDPTWYHRGKVVPPGPANPLGTRWMGLSLKGYGIHGTNRPKSIGRAASHGCIRMRKSDVEELFELMHVGDGVELTTESVVRNTNNAGQALAE